MKNFFFIFSIIRYNSNKDFLNISPSDSKSLLNILISDSFVFAVDSDILYRDNVLAFLVTTATLKSSPYPISYNRRYSIFYS